MDHRARHHRRRSFDDPGDVHELTFSCYRKYRFLESERTCEWLARAIENARERRVFDLWACVFMPEHVHLIQDPLEHEAKARGCGVPRTPATRRFSEDWRHHEAVTYLTMYVYNFCWPVRTLRIKDDQGNWRGRSPAMVAGLADHVWSIPEWLAFPPVRR